MARFPTKRPARASFRSRKGNNMRTLHKALIVVSTRMTRLDAQTLRTFERLSAVRCVVAAGMSRDRSGRRIRRRPVDSTSPFKSKRETPAKGRGRRGGRKWRAWRGEAPRLRGMPRVALNALTLSARVGNPDRTLMKKEMARTEHAASKRPLSLDRKRAMWPIDDRQIRIAGFNTDTICCVARPQPG